MFDNALKSVISIEGFYSDDPNDPGNWTGGRVGVGILKGTKYGISAGSYPELQIKHLTLKEARVIYHRDFWNKMNLGLLVPYSNDLANMLFNLGVNCGARRGIMFLQAAINTLNFTEDLQIKPIRNSAWQQEIVRMLNGKPLKVDGINGPRTRSVLSMIPHRVAVTVAVFGEAYIHYSRGKLMYRAGWLNRLGALMIK